MQSIITFCLLKAIQILSRIFYRYDDEYLGPIPARQWGNLRAIIILNHTSLYEPLLVGFADSKLLWAFARHGVLPIAEKTMRRKIGLFFRFLVRHVVIITRQRDHTWNRVLNHVDEKSLVIILPEGRMKRANGLDSSGNPMTIRGGIADILENLHEGRLLLLYSGGLHHIQVPGQTLPKLFKTLHVRMELIDVEDYKAGLDLKSHDMNFKSAVIRDLTERRDLHCPELEKLCKGQLTKYSEEDGPKIPSEPLD